MSSLKSGTCHRHSTFFPSFPTVSRPWWYTVYVLVYLCVCVCACVCVCVFVCARPCTRTHTRTRKLSQRPTLILPSRKHARRSGALNSIFFLSALALLLREVKRKRWKLNSTTRKTTSLHPRSVSCACTCKCVGNLQQALHTAIASARGRRRAAGFVSDTKYHRSKVYSWS